MINEYENVLRRLIINIIGKNDNSEYKVSHDRLEKWKEKREILSLTSLRYSKKLPKNQQ